MGTRAHSPALILLVVVALCGICRGDSTDLSVSVRPVFAGLAALEGTLPLSIEVANRGAGTSGRVVVKWESSSIAYPVDLPRGSRKQLMVYAPMSSLYSEASVLLETGEGDLEAPIKIGEVHARQSIGLIGGSIGDMTFLRTTTAPSDTGVSASDSYGRPGSLPDRPAGYSAFIALVLGEGSERMKDEEVAAIKTWVVGGGSLIFIGGASSPVLDDRRWAEFLPVGPVTPRNVDGIRTLERLGGSPPPAGRISLALGRPLPGSNVVFSAGQSPVVVRQRVGLGQTIYLAFDPFQPPLKQWGGLRKLFLNGIGLDQAIANQEWLFRQTTGDPEARSDPHSSSGPFNAKLPNSGTVFLILILHLIIAVPMNFLLLRKIGKGELAWVTTPIISMAFAAVFFSLAAGLYKSGQATRSRGTLLVSSLHNEGYFRGHTEIFIPRGGAYDLKLQNVDSVTTGMSEDYAPWGQPLEAVDDGAVQIPQLRVSNLAFRELFYSQRIAAPRWLDGSIKNVDDTSIKCSISNNSPYDLASAKIVFGKLEFNAGQIASGETLQKTLTSDSTGWELWSDEQSVVVEGTLVGFKPGPQIGQDDGSKIRFVYFWGPIE
ncbi:MAG: hypothetical protein H0W86_01085 [Armatimonadetes bacterium]|nr:hypothetical protein [Armatimonadota bacterium]